MCLLTGIIAKAGKEAGFTLPDPPKGTKVGKTFSEAEILNRYRQIAKKTLNIWLTKLRKKFRPKTKRNNKTKKNVTTSVTRGDESEDAVTEQE